MKFDRFRYPPFRYFVLFPCLETRSEAQKCAINQPEPTTTKSKRNKDAPIKKKLYAIINCSELFDEKQKFTRVNRSLAFFVIPSLFHQNIYIYIDNIQIFLFLNKINTLIRNYRVLGNKF